MPRGWPAMVDPVAAVQNYDRLAALGAQGRFGFYEAVDFTTTRLPENEDYVLVRSFMAHHQGMTITSIANALQNGRLRDRFHAEPMIQGVELLLHERVPRDVAAAPPRAKNGLVGALQNSRCAHCAGVRRARKSGADGASAVQRELRSDADRDGRGLQPLAGSGNYTLAGRGDTGSAWVIHLCPGYVDRNALVCRGSADARGCSTPPYRIQ